MKWDNFKSYINNKFTLVANFCIIQFFAEKDEASADKKAEIHLDFKN